MPSLAQIIDGFDPNAGFDVPASVYARTCLS